MQKNGDHTLKAEIITDKIYQKNQELALYKPCGPVDVSEMKELFDTLVEVAKEHNALGVAANQVGITKQAFVAKVKNPYESVHGETYYGFFNPEVLETFGDNDIMEEGCLSFPGLYVKIKRPWGVKLKFFNEEGEEKVEVFQGLTTRIILHEMDHLMGRRFFDAASRLHFEQAMRNYKKWSRNQKRG